VSVAAAIPGLERGAFERLVAMLDECSREQLESIRELVTGALINYPTKEEEDMPKRVEEFEGRSMQMAMEIWDAMKGDSDPAAAELPDDTLARIVGFAKEIRNRTIEDLAAAVDKAYSKFTQTVVADIRKQKE
jgi:hypothetical protein